MIIQIYEIQKPQEAEKCIELGVNHLGSVLLSQDTWRVRELKDVVRLSDGTDMKNSIIPLFRDKDNLFRSLDYYRPHYVHLCHSLTDDEGREKGLESYAISPVTQKRFLSNCLLNRHSPGGAALIMHNHLLQIPCRTLSCVVWPFPCYI